MGTQSPGTMKKTDYMLSGAMIRLLEKKCFRKITVNDICQEAMISRSAFYQHFADKYELMSFCIENQLKMQSDKIRSASVEQALVMMLENVQDKQKLIYNFFRADLSQELMDIFLNAFQRFVKDWLEELKESGMQLPEPLEMLTAFLAGGLSGMVFRWIQEGFSTPKEMVARCQYDLLMRTLGVRL